MLRFGNALGIAWLAACLSVWRYHKQHHKQGACLPFLRLLSGSCCQRHVTIENEQQQIGKQQVNLLRHLEQSRTYRSKRFHQISQKPTFFFANCLVWCDILYLFFPQHPVYLCIYIPI